ncbi:MAG: flagellin [Candidatus Latescibacteria bacterium]|nr:flagellin [Candidatus Latescibacterota bacterium]
MRINNNISAMNTHRLISQTDRALSGSLERLSSGLRINRAADDSAGLAISQRLRSQVEGLKMASQNAEQAKNVVQTAEGYLNEVHNMLGRMRELAVQSSSDTVDNTNRTSLQAEFSSLREEITRIANAAEYNNQKLLDGTYNGTFQIGANNTENDTISFTISGADAATLTVNDSDISTRAGANSALDELTTAIDSVSSTRSDLGTIQNRLAFTVASVDNAAENLASSESTIRDLDISQEVTSFTKSQILTQAGMSMLAQANAVPQNVLSLFQ